MSEGILVVDDDRGMVKTFVDILRLKGWEADGAYGGREAVAAIERREYAVVLMDVRMPDVDGVQALRRIKELRPRTSVLLMTAYTAAELLAEAERAGALRILSKPLALPLLLETLDAAARAAAPETILIVDDDADFLKTLADVLRAAGHPTVVAETLHEAVLRMDEASPRVVLLDLRLDHFEPADGILAIRRMDPAVAIILCSGHPDLLRESADQAPAGWIRGTLQKPFPPERLIRMIEEMHRPS